MKNIIFDLDGVLGNLVGKTCELFGLDYEETMAKWPRGIFSFEAAMGFDASKFHNGLSAAGEEWWEGIKPYPYFADLWAGAKKLAPTYILTRPTLHHTSASGKVRWLRKHFGDTFDDYLIGAPKFLCASPNNLLIDDHDGNVASFIEAGGSAILFPQPWNARHREADDNANIVAAEIAEWACAV